MPEAIAYLGRRDRCSSAGCDEFSSPNGLESGATNNENLRRFAARFIASDVACLTSQTPSTQPIPSAALLQFTQVAPEMGDNGQQKYPGPALAGFHPMRRDRHTGAFASLTRNDFFDPPIPDQ